VRGVIGAVRIGDAEGVDGLDGMVVRSAEWMIWRELSGAVEFALD